MGQKLRGQSAFVLEYASAYFAAAVATSVVYFVIQYAQAPVK